MSVSSLFRITRANTFILFLFFLSLYPAFAGDNEGEATTPNAYINTEKCSIAVDMTCTVNETGENCLPDAGDKWEIRRRDCGPLLITITYKICNLNLEASVIISNIRYNHQNRAMPLDENTILSPGECRVFEKQRRFNTCKKNKWNVSISISGKVDEENYMYCYKYVRRAVTLSYKDEEIDDNAPNVIVIMTDEHNYRTLGCYRKYLRSIGQKDQRNPWGNGGKRNIFTPNIDSLADDGALFSNFYTVAPLCTPSRASFLSGLYPQFTGGSKGNFGEMDANITTFANILKNKGKYTTSYMGKWHLSGKKKPGWYDPGRNFGFFHTRYKYNRGHWKYFDVDGKKVRAYPAKSEAKFQDTQEEHYGTDFLFDRGIEFIEKNLDKDDPFAIMLSIPDPHTPSVVRPPYRGMFKKLKFEYPATGKAKLLKNPASPKWNRIDHEDINLQDAEEYITAYEQGKFYQNSMQQYFGMVKCIDDNVGKLLNFLKEKNIDDNTIVVFTSDHGALKGEHGKLDKGVPFEMSAGVPLLIRYPKKIPRGKIIETPHSSVDFAPTLIGLLGIDTPQRNFHGIDATPELQSNKTVENEDHIVFTMDTQRSNAGAKWVAAIAKGYKLVISKNDVPWLFDLNLNPEETLNYFDYPSHTAIVNMLQSSLLEKMKEYKFPLIENYGTFFWDMPACMDSPDAVTVDNRKILCADLGVSVPIGLCSDHLEVRSKCAVTCGQCAEDSVGKIMVKRELKACNELVDWCHSPKVKEFCPEMCSTHK